MSNTIHFISGRDEYGWLSNFHYAPFEYNGKTWLTVEHAFQAAKVEFKGPWAEKIRTAKAPGIAKRLGRDCPLRKDWEHVKLGIMLDLVKAKFLSNPELGDKLLLTERRTLEEDAYWDTFWGTGKTGPGGRGRNELGKVLMAVRTQLAAERKK
jgi:ribA/ribD-fused uncharacterized protein